MICSWRTPLQKCTDRMLRGAMSVMHCPLRREKTEDGSAPSVSPHAGGTSMCSELSTTLSRVSN